MQNSCRNSHDEDSIPSIGAVWIFLICSIAHLTMFQDFTSLIFNRFGMLELISLVSKTEFQSSRYQRVTWKWRPSARPLGRGDASLQSPKAQNSTKWRCQALDRGPKGAADPTRWPELHLQVHTSADINWLVVCSAIWTISVDQPTNQNTAEHENVWKHQSVKLIQIRTTKFCSVFPYASSYPCSR